MSGWNRVTFCFSDAKSLGTSGLDKCADPAAIVAQSEAYRRLDEWAAALPDEEKFSLRTLTGEWTLAQAASHLNVVPSTVSRRRSRWLDASRRALAEIAP